MSILLTSLIEKVKNDLIHTISKKMDKAFLMSNVNLQKIISTITVLKTTNLSQADKINIMKT